MKTLRLNGWIVGGLGFCLVIWAVAAFTFGKTTNLYLHRSNAGFRHDFIEHARGHWLTFKHEVEPAKVKKS